MRAARTPAQPRRTRSSRPPSKHSVSSDFIKGGPSGRPFCLWAGTFRLEPFSAKWIRFAAKECGTPRKGDDSTQVETALEHRVDLGFRTMRRGVGLGISGPAFYRLLPLLKGFAAMRFSPFRLSILAA